MHLYFSLSNYLIRYQIQVVSRYGKEEVLTGPHRPYGKNSVSIGEIKRIRAAGGWVCFHILFSLHIFITDVKSFNFFF